MFVSTVVVAAGSGSRMRTSINKLYIQVAGKPLIARTIEKFEKSEIVNEIILVVNEADIESFKKNIVERFGFKKVTKVVPGGSDRGQSARNGLLFVDGKSDIVMVHDGARPFVGPECIEKSIKAAAEFGVASVGVPVKDTIKIVNSQNFIDKTPDRESLWASQTPQAFKKDIILDVYNRAETEGVFATDDVMLAEHYGYSVKMVMGSYDNIKVTTPEDLDLCENLVSRSEWK